jgi:hypothetical protein
VFRTFLRIYPIRKSTLQLQSSNATFNYIAGVLNKHNLTMMSSP